MSEDHQAGPLADIKVVELGQLIAGPFCGQLMADFGADVIKIERPDTGDPMREWGQERSKGESLWFPVIARGKRSVTIDLRKPEGQELARQIIRSADIVIENFRPCTMERWGLGYEDLSKDNPGLIMVRVSGFGQSGPYAQRAGYGSIGEAFGGMRYVVGDPSMPPSRIGFSIGDSLAATYAFIGALVALHAREKSGTGQVVDSAIFEAVLAMTENMVTEYAASGYIRERSGSVLPNVAPSNVYPTSDGISILIAANQDSVFRRLCSAMDRPEMADDPRYATHIARGAHQAELDDIIADWTRTLQSESLESLVSEHGVPSGRIFRPSEMLVDPHYEARGSLVRQDHPSLGELVMQNVFPRLSATPGGVSRPAPALGEHNAAVFRDLGLDADDIERLRKQKVVR